MTGKTVVALAVSLFLSGLAGAHSVSAPPNSEL